MVCPPYLFAERRICAVQMSLISGNGKISARYINDFMHNQQLFHVDVGPFSSIIVIITIKNTFVKRNLSHEMFRCMRYELLQVHIKNNLKNLNYRPNY